MSQIGMALYVGLALHLIFATTLHQGAADVLSTPVPSPPTTTPAHKGPGIPAQGHYSVKNDSGTICLKANMALQINISFHSASLNKIVQKVVNLNPNETTTSGSCDKESATLILNAGQKTELSFKFTLNTTSNKYYLNGVSILAIWSDMTDQFSDHNDSLDYLRGSLGFSYMCRSEQTLVVSQNSSLNTFLLHVQPFGLSGDTLDLHWNACWMKMTW
ncbi:hypothetical protein WMY93_028624 [Mugilogobius chulae]|uniref:Lysosome-associated membrane glycoprotein 2-like luminal domain-containing protein n=1 Tax=Mugilogobius chulae TaxID=88201 RepID=A0AAW0MQS3_9GOBI